MTTIIYPFYHSKTTPWTKFANVLITIVVFCDSVVLISAEIVDLALKFEKLSTFCSVNRRGVGYITDEFRAILSFNTSRKEYFQPWNLCTTNLL